MEDKLEFFLDRYGEDQFFYSMDFESPIDLIKNLVHGVFTPEKTFPKSEDFVCESNHIYLFQLYLPEVNFGTSAVIFTRKRKSTIIVFGNYTRKTLHMSNKLLNFYVNKFLIDDMISEVQDELQSEEDDESDCRTTVQECYFDGKLMLKDLENIIRKEHSEDIKQRPIKLFGTYFCDDDIVTPTDYRFEYEKIMKV